jgi:hypothetical protein
MSVNIARRLTAAEERLQAGGGRNILIVVEPDDSEARINERIGRDYGSITEADKVTRIATGVKRCAKRWA